MNREYTAAFTGHRTYNGEADNRLHDEIRRLYDAGYRTFLSGMAIGFDIYAAEAVLALRNELHGIELVCIIPFAGQDASFSEEYRRRFAAIVATADRTITLAPRYTPTAYRHRNDFLVEHSSALIAYYDGSQGGTDYTVRRALHALSDIVNIYNNPQLQLQL